MINVQNIATVIGYLTLYPENHDQTDWYNNSYQALTAKEMRNPKCGTKMCLAGWASAIGAPDNAVFDNGYGFTVNGEPTSAESFAREFLGLDDDVAHWLFYGVGNEQIVPCLKYLVKHPYADVEELEEAVDY